MDIFSIFTLAGGLALFLYGMHVLSVGLEKMAGSRMEQILRKLTSNRIKGLALGAAVTAVIQSSSATTVMLVGLVNSGIMKLGQAISVTMGSNIGTTVTAWILSLAGISSDAFWIQLMKPKNFSPLIALIGVILIMAAKSQKKKDIGTICIGFAILMYGMTIMSGAVEPLADVPQFRSILVAFSNPFLGVLVGLLFTAVIQSSSASVGVLQALAMTGAVSFGSAIPIIMGQNIGTCVSAMLASIGTNKNAKRVATVHVLFNMIGTAICLTVWSIANRIFSFAITARPISPFEIAVVHSIFNVVTTVLLIPFASVLEKVACLIIRDDQQKKEETVMLDERLMTVPSFATAKAMNVTVKMSDLAAKSVNAAISVLNAFSEKDATTVKTMENQLDIYEDQLSSYLVKLSRLEVTDEDSKKISLLLHSIGDFERIGDHAENLMETAREITEKKISFSAEAKKELDTLSAAIMEILGVTMKAYEANDPLQAAKVEPLEQVIDTLTSQIRSRHIIRLQQGNCTIELGFILTDLLTNYERISDHCSNIAVAVIEAKRGIFDAHAYLNSVKEEPDSSFTNAYEKYQRQYALEDLT